MPTPPQKDNQILSSFKDLAVIKTNLLANKAKPENTKAKTRFDEAWQMIRSLQTLYPQTFNQAQPLPLAIGTAKEIRKQHPNFNLSTLRFALAIWTRRKQYLNAVLTSESRHYLDGSVATKIQHQEKQYSNELKEKYRKKLKNNYS